MTNDANILCQPRELQTLQDLAEINDTIKEMETEKQKLVTEAKQIMSKYNVDSLTFDDHKYALVKGSRRTVTKSTKNEFISELIAAGKNHLVHTSIEPDLDEIFAEVEAGNIAADFVDRYVKVTPVTSLRVT